MPCTAHIKNGQPFTVIAHSTTNGLYLDDSFKNNLNSFLSCSIFDTECMNYYNNPVVITFNITNENYIACSSFDSATITSSYGQDVHTVAITPNGEVIRAGYTYTEDIDKIVVKCENPEDVLKRIRASANYNIVNETILSKEKVKPTGLILFTDGRDYLLPYYLIAHKMSLKYHIPICLIDRKKYNTHSNEKISLQEFVKQIEKSHYHLWNNTNLTTEEKAEIIKNFDDLLMKECPYSKEKMDLCHQQLLHFYHALSPKEPTKKI